MGDSPKLIAVTGPTGAGKSTFINLVCGSNLQVGNSLRSCTAEIQLASCTIEEQQVVLIDTPGFDDTERSQAQILEDIAEFMASTYEDGKKLAGLIYMHRISDERVGGIARENFRLFSKICGDDAMKNVLIVTSMWEQVKAETGTQREKELREKQIFFKDAIDHNARMVRHYNTVVSAQGVVRQILGYAPETLQLQQEIVVDKMTLPMTAAGVELESELDKQSAEYSRRMQEMRAEMDEILAKKDAHHKEDMRRLKENCRALEKKLKKVEGEVTRLRQTGKKHIGAEKAVDEGKPRRRIRIVMSPLGTPEIYYEDRWPPCSIDGH